MSSCCPCWLLIVWVYFSFTLVLSYDPLPFYLHLIIRIHVGFEILTAVAMKSSALWDMPCDPVKVGWLFREHIASIIRFQRISQEETGQKQSSICIVYSVTISDVSALSLDSSCIFSNMLLGFIIAVMYRVMLENMLVTKGDCYSVFM
jgi:hypothetical protein